MYQNDLFERLRANAARSGARKIPSKISPTVWALGLTSFLTDISSEMVTSVLPIYLFNYLRLSPVQFGAVVHAVDWDGEARWRALSAPTSLNPIADAAARSHHHVNLAHTFGRFRIAHFDELDIAVLVRHVDTPVYAMRLPESARTI